MPENSISEDLVPIRHEKRKQWWRLILLVLSPVAIFWMVFGYHFYKVPENSQMGAMNFIPRCRVALYKMLGERFKFQATTLDYGDWEPLATATVRPGLVRNAPVRALKEFHEPSVPVASLRIATLESRETIPPPHGQLSFSTKGDAGTMEAENAGIILANGPTGEVTIPNAGTVTLQYVAIRTPDPAGVGSPTRFFNSQGLEVPRPIDAKALSQGRKHAMKAAINFQQGTAHLVGLPRVRVFDRLTHAQFCFAKSSRTASWTGGYFNLELDGFCMSRPTKLRFGVEYLSRLEPPLELPAKAGVTRRDDFLEAEVAAILTGKYVRGVGFTTTEAFTTTERSGISIRPDTKQNAKEHTTIVLHTPKNMLLLVTAVTQTNQEVSFCPETGGRLHECVFALPLAEIVKLRVHRLVLARCFVDIGPIDPFPGSTPGATDELEDVFPEFDLRTFHSDDMLSQALGGQERPRMNRFLNGFSETTVKNKTIRQILQHIEADPGYKGGKILIEQKQGWIWTGR